MAPARLACLVLAAFVLTAGAAAELVLRADPPTAPLRPGVEAAPVAIHVDIPCEALLARADPAPMTDGAPLEFRIGQADPNVLITGSFTIFVPVEPCAPGSFVTVDHEFTLVLRPDAPGLESLTAEIRAVLSPRHVPEPLVEEEEGSVRFQVVGAYAPQLALRTDEKIVELSGDGAVLHLDITNFGNAKTIVTFSLGPGSSQPGAAVELPQPAALNSALSGLRFEQHLAIPVHDLGGRWSQALVELVATPHAFLDQENVGEPAVLAFLVQQSTLERLTPMPGGVMLFMVVVGLAAARRL
jgi:hypothetical protein